MADDATTPDGTSGDGATTDGEALLVDRGECPICAIEFDDPNVFRDHLGEVHDLFDEEGATTALWIPTLDVVEADPASEPTIPDTPVPVPPVSAARQRAPVGLIVLVVLLIVFGG